MRFADVDVFGVVVSSFVPMMLTAAVATLVLRRLMIATGLLRRAWHPAFVEFSFFVILLSLTILFFGGFDARC